MAKEALPSNDQPIKPRVCIRCGGPVLRLRGTAVCAACTKARISERADARRGPEIRVCTECGGPVSHRHGKAVCKNCAKINRQTYLKEYMPSYREENKEAIAAKHKEYLEVHSDRVMALARENALRWYKNNPERARESAKAAYLANPEAYKEAATRNRARRRAEDPEEFLRKQAEYVRERRTSNPQVLVSSRMSNRVWYAMKSRKSRKEGSWKLHVDYTVDQLIARLKETMPVGHAWDDFMSGYLHIDHIRPVASFEFQSEEDPGFKECWALTNLQLLPGPENIRKSDRLDWLPGPADTTD